MSQKAATAHGIECWFCAGNCTQIGYGKYFYKTNKWLQKTSMVAVCALEFANVVERSPL
jgi:hypothetical protein